MGTIPGGEGELGDEGGEVHVPDAVFLTGHTGSIDQHPVLVDNINNGSNFAGEGTILNDGNPTDLNKLVERLKQNENSLRLAIRLP